MSRGAGGMKIDQRALTAAISAAADCGWNFEKPFHRADMAAIIRAYLAALPHEPAEKGRDRIAVLVPANMPPKFFVLPYGMATKDVAWDSLKPKCAGPVATCIIRCNLPRPATPIEVEGSVEAVR